MLANAFLSAKDLDLTERERTALILVLGVLESGEITWTQVDDIDDMDGPDYEPPPGNHFSMAYWLEEGDCGTVCCIGGLAEKLGNVQFPFDDPRPVNGLFFPVAFERVIELHTITVEQAAKATRNFLTTGHPDWNEVLK